MNYLELFSCELQHEETRYFILDTKGSGSDHGDVDFTQYRWQTNKFGKVRENDLILYRRPGKASETKKFYFFGAAKIGSIKSIDSIKEKRVEAKIESEYPFKTHLHPHDLENYQWDFKERTPGTWEHFFNQYGMNQITRIDFLNLLSLSDSDDETYDPKAATEALQAIQRKNYYVEDQKGSAARRSKQSVFSNAVKNNYKNQCAICGITTRSFLIGSHIIPWSHNKNHRLDPANGISLCVLHDKLFDKGFITLDTSLKVIFSKELKKDSSLMKMVEHIENTKLIAPKENSPKEEYLTYHRKKIFIDNKINS